GLDISEPGLGKALQRLAVGIETLYSNIQLALCLVSDQAPLRLPFPLRVYRQRQGLDIAVCQTKLLQGGDGSINLAVDTGFQLTDALAVRAGSGMGTEPVSHGLDTAFAADFDKMPGGGGGDGVVAAGKEGNGQHGQPGNRTHAMTPEILVGRRLVA